MALREDHFPFLNLAMCVFRFYTAYLMLYCLAMLRYIKNINISTYHFDIDKLNIDFSIYCHAKSLLLKADFIFLDSNAGNKFTTGVKSINRLNNGI